MPILITICNRLSGVTVVCTESLSLLESDVETVHRTLLGDDVVMPHICRLLEQLGVRRLTAADMIHHHILPTLRSPDWQVTTVGFCRYHGGLFSA